MYTYIYILQFLTCRFEGKYERVSPFSLITTTQSSYRAKFLPLEAEPWFAHAQATQQHHGPAWVRLSHTADMSGV